MHLEVIAMRRHPDLSMDQALRIAESQTVPCRPRASRRGCGVPAGVPCVSLATGRPLGGLGAHVDRLTDARTAKASTPSQRSAPGPASTGSPRELVPA